LGYYDASELLFSSLGHAEHLQNQFVMALRLCRASRLARNERGILIVQPPEINEIRGAGDGECLLCR
jgi:hypothetical protein